MMKLSKRLSEICAFVPSSQVIADIGSDHGQLAMALSLRGDSKKIFASDNKKGPFERLKKSIEQFQDGITPIEVYLASGLDLLPPSVTCVIIAGMGGDLISHILLEGKEKLDSHGPLLILQANTMVPFLRKNLVNLGYSIQNESIVEDGKFYEIIVAKKGRCTLNEDDLYFGPILRKEKSKTFCLYYQNRLNEINRLLENSLPIKRKEDLLAEKERIENMLYEN